ncbi:MAG TPA: CDP-alcohol phosphatidyltransferase family protein [Kofleriaceae bacterium]|nr:CDP-alcohol phosphatidyltransferase family protein [Kofleriaceae bacterium]
MHAAPEHIFTAPNVLTLARVPLGAAVWLAPGNRAWLVAILVAAAVSDVLDGRVARAIRRERLARGRDPGDLGEAQAVGAWLDPMCDKIFVASVLAAVAVTYRPPVELVVLIATRELVLVPLVAAYRFIPALRRRLHFDFRAGRLGKLTTVIQFAAVGAVVFWPPGARELSVVASVAGLAAATRYLQRAFSQAPHPARSRSGKAARGSDPAGSRSRTA